MKEIEGRNGGKLNPSEKGDAAKPGAGRPVGSISAKTRLKKLLASSIKRKNELTGSEEKKTIGDFLDIALVVKALGGDVAAYREITDRVDGKVDQKVITEDVSKPKVSQMNEKHLKALEKAFGNTNHTSKQGEEPQK